MKWNITLIMLAAIILTTHTFAKSIVLQSGDVVTGEIVSSDENGITVRTSSGISNYHFSELDLDWTKDYFAQQERYAARLAALQQERRQALSRTDRKNSNWFPEFRDHVLSKENLVAGLSAVFMSIGLFLCFFGWTMYRFFTVLGGAISGLIMGFLLAGLILSMISNFLPDSVPGIVPLVLFVVIAGPLALFGARYGRRFAMFNARSRRLHGRGKGMLNIIFALSRFAFFDLSIVWGHSFVGAFFVLLACYGFIMRAFVVPEQYQKALWIGCGVAALTVCIFGSLSQIHNLRSEKNSGHRGEY